MLTHPKGGSGNLTHHGCGMGVKPSHGCSLTKKRGGTHGMGAGCGGYAPVKKGPKKKGK